MVSVLVRVKIKKVARLLAEERVGVDAKVGRRAMSLRCLGKCVGAHVNRHFIYGTHSKVEQRVFKWILWRSVESFAKEICLGGDSHLRRAQRSQLQTVKLWSAPLPTTSKGVDTKQLGIKLF